MIKILSARVRLNNLCYSTKDFPAYHNVVDLEGSQQTYNYYYYHYDYCS